MWPWVILMLAAIMLPSSYSAPRAQSSVRVRFISPPMSYSHGVDGTIVGGTTIQQPSGYSRGRVVSSRTRLQSSSGLAPSEGYPASRRSSRLTVRQSAIALPVISSDPESMWPTGVFIPPDTQLLQLILHNDDFYISDPDPFLLSESDAEIVVKALFDHGELFYSDYPHARALRRHQDERLANGLAGNRLGSIRPDSEFYRWPNMKPRRPVPGYPPL